MCTHNQCFEQKYKNFQNVSNEIFIIFEGAKIAVCHMGEFS